MAQRCSCELTLALLEILGGSHAKRMRAAGKTQTADWSARDWLSHIAEEEALFFPMLPPPVRARLMEDHAIIRRKLAGSPRGRIDSDLAVPHAELEDQWAQAIATRRGWNLHDHKPAKRGHPRSS